jgi:hypothetical protein
MTSVVAFNPELHQKVRFNDQLFAIFLSDEDFNRLPPNAEVVIHFVSRDKIFYRKSTEDSDIYLVKKEELTLVEPHIIE